MKSVADLDVKVRYSAEEYIAMQDVAAKEIRSLSNLQRYAMILYLRQRLDLIRPELRGSLGTGWDE